MSGATRSPTCSGSRSWLPVEGPTKSPTKSAWRRRKKAGAAAGRSVAGEPPVRFVELLAQPLHLGLGAARPRERELRIVEIPGAVRQAAARDGNEGVAFF